MPTAIERFISALQNSAADYDVQLKRDDFTALGDYYTLLLKWNTRLHLVAPCAPEVFATRHILESLMLNRYLPLNSRVVDVGSGAGLPLLPCALVRPDLRVTLIEASKKKVIFLREALRITHLEHPDLISARFEQLPAPSAEFATSRALDRFPQMLTVLTAWVPPGCTLLIFAGAALRKQIETKFPTAERTQIPGSAHRFLMKFTKNPRH